MSKLEMTIRTKLAVHERMVVYHETKEETYKALFHTGIVDTLKTLLDIITGGFI